MTPANPPANAIATESVDNLGDALVTGGEPTGAASLEKVRDILFGSISRAYDRRFAELGARLDRELASAAQEAERCFEAMAARVESACKRMLTQRRQESSARTVVMDGSIPACSKRCAHSGDELRCYQACGGKHCPERKACA